MWYLLFLNLSEQHINVDRKKGQQTKMPKQLYFSCSGHGSKKKFLFFLLLKAKNYPQTKIISKNSCKPKTEKIINFPRLHFISVHNMSPKENMNTTSTHCMINNLQHLSVFHQVPQEHQQKNYPHNTSLSIQAVQV